MDELWERWEPCIGLGAKQYVEYIQDDMNIFKIRLYETYHSTERIDILFNDQVYAYRRTDETLRARILLFLDAKYGNLWYANWSLFAVTNSNYIDWLSKESCTISDHMLLQHFAIVAGDSLVDIATTYEPQVQHVTIQLPA